MTNAFSPDAGFAESGREVFASQATDALSESLQRSAL
jgi:hypothetical protein